MKFEFDPAKDAANIAKHGVSLTCAGELQVAVIVVDDRIDYGEERFNAFGMIDGVAYCLTFKLRDDKVRAISLRRARAKEYRRHGLSAPADPSRR